MSKPIEPDDDLPIVQRTVSASATGITKPTGAAASVFDAGKQAKPQRKPRKVAPPLDVEAVEVQSGVELPPIHTNVRSTYGRLLERMSPGDRIVLSGDHTRSFVSFAKKAGVKVAIRKLENEQCGIWRLPLPDPA